MDGYYAIDPIPVREESVSDPMIDIVSSHHYERDPDHLRAFVGTNLEVVRGRTPYVIGEFGFVGTSAVERVLDDAIESGISGALVWSLRFHRHEGGFYWHSEPLGGGLFKAYHWPGFASRQCGSTHTDVRPAHTGERRRESGIATRRSAGLTSRRRPARRFAELLQSTRTSALTVGGRGVDSDT
jgi:hypothetical protein